MKPKLTKILKNDYNAMLCAIIPLAYTLLYFGLQFYNYYKDANNTLTTDDVILFVWTFAITLLICTPLLYKRIKNIRNIFENGIIVPGKITKVVYYKDRGILSYEYEYGDYVYGASVGIHQTKDTRGYQVGYPIDVVVSKEDPTRTLIKHLYV